MDQADFPDPLTAPDDVELIAVGQFDIYGEPIVLNPGGLWPKLTVDGSNWSSEVILKAYRLGLFPMPLDAIESPNVISWWSPNPRGVLKPNEIKVSNSLKKSLKKFDFTIDQEFENVVRNCGNPARPSGWITQEVVSAYLDLHEIGLAHSIEVWNKSGHLVGGLYGLELGGLFAGESMFHLESDASKAALVKLADFLDDQTNRLIDCQWRSEHLATLGVREISRNEYISQLPELLKLNAKFN